MKLLLAILLLGACGTPTASVTPRIEFTNQFGVPVTVVAPGIYDDGGTTITGPGGVCASMDRIRDTVRLTVTAAGTRYDTTFTITGSPYWAVGLAPEGLLIASLADEPCT
jgi:hypothetical protein